MASRQYVTYGLRALLPVDLQGLFSQSPKEIGKVCPLCVASGEYLDGDALMSIFFSEPRLLLWSSAILDLNLSIRSTKEGL